MRYRFLLIIALILASFGLAALAQDSTEVADSTQADTTAVDSAVADSAKVDSTEVDSAKTDTAETDTLKADSTSKDSIETDSTETDTVKVDSTSKDSIETDSTETDTVKVDSTSKDSVETDSAKTDTVKADTTKEESPLLDSLKKAQASQADSAKVDSTKADTTRRQSPLLDELKSEAAKRDSAKADSAAAAQDSLGEVVPDSLDSAVVDSAAIAPPEEKPAHYTVGAKKCKICHKDEYTSWMVTAHARTIERLDIEEKLDLECLACHSTGKTSGGALLEGVQCEACHGPGNDYRKSKIMKDKDLSKENGLIEPNEEVCQRCHNETSPTFDGFDYESFIQRLEEIHVMKSRDKKKDKE